MDVLQTLMRNKKSKERYHSLLQKKSKAGINPILIFKIDIKNINPMKPSL